MAIMNQGDLFATTAEPKKPWECGWYKVTYVDPETGIWRAISDLGRFPSVEAANEDIAREQPRHLHKLFAIALELAGQKAATRKFGLPANYTFASALERYPSAIVITWYDMHTCPAQFDLEVYYRGIWVD